MDYSVMPLVFGLHLSTICANNPCFTSADKKRSHAHHSKRTERESSRDHAMCASCVAVVRRPRSTANSFDWVQCSFYGNHTVNWEIPFHFYCTTITAIINTYAFLFILNGKCSFILMLSLQFTLSLHSPNSAVSVLSLRQTAQAQFLYKPSSEVFIEVPCPHNIRRSAV